MKKYVLDSYALLAYCEGEESGKHVSEILKKGASGDAEIYVSVINWGELYYIALRDGGKERAETYRTTIEKYPITIINADIELTLIAAKYKASYKLSYADAFAAALAEEKKAVLVTGDKEFNQIGRGLKINWI